MVNKLGESPIYLRITYNGENSSLSLHRSINANFWNTKLGKAEGSDRNLKDLNRYLISVQSTVYEHYRNLREGRNPVTALNIRNAYLGI